VKPSSDVHRWRPGFVALGVAASLLLWACGSDSSGGDDGPVTLTLVTYSAFVEPPSLAAFSARTGITVNVARAGDAGTLVNKAILTKGRPEGDVLWGLDNTLLSRALDEQGLFVAYESPELANVDPSLTSLVPDHEVTPVSTGDVCLNYDRAWFSERKVLPPASLTDLTHPALADLLVVPNPATSSPGLAFLLATVAQYGDPGYLQFWRDLRTNGVKVVEDWDTAYYTEFTAGGGGGGRPIVVSYSSSPPATILFAEPPAPAEPTTVSVDTTCLRQIEFAGVLQGTEHEDEARQLLDFFLSEELQTELPLSNFVYPVRTGVALPAVFEQFGRPSARPFLMDPQRIADERETWIDAWTAAVLR
jgi:thiamine transport system substrate-binding protein